MGQTGIERKRGRENGSFPVAESSESASVENRGVLKEPTASEIPILPSLEK